MTRAGRCGGAGGRAIAAGRRTGDSKSQDVLFSAAIGFERVWIAHLGVQSGIWKALARRGKWVRPEELASDCALNNVAARMWCQAAHALSLLDRRGERYRLRRGAASALADEMSPDYVGGLASYLALRSTSYGAFQDWMRGGLPQGAGFEPNRAAYEEATKWDHTAFLDQMVPRFPVLERKLSAGARVLDIGAGSGGWAVRVAERFPRSSVVAVEPDEGAVRAASKAARGSGRLHRVKVVRGRAEAIPFDRAFDLVYLGEVLYLASSPVEALCSARRALARGGWLAVAEGLIERGKPPRVEPNPLLFALRLDYALQGGRMLFKDELGAAICQAGFRRALFHHAGGGLWFAFARR